MKNEMPSLLLDENICFYKVTSIYTATFVAGHYVLKEHSSPHNTFERETKV
jgi:hypothetical protein